MNKLHPPLMLVLALLLCGMTSVRAAAPAVKADAVTTAIAAAPEAKTEVKAPAVTEAPAESTLANLQAAYNGESNAKAKYEAFAKKADEEGYAGVATLFRAAAQAEGVHLASHAKVIKALKGEPTAVIVAPEVKSTKENLAAAVAGETYENRTMYPQFIKLAKKQKNNQAVLSFTRAMKVEAVHAALYNTALASIEKWKTADKVFLVCPVCGYTTDDATLKKCPICAEPRKKFMEVK
ncbi:MAG: rubrerythrin family protein [bacterium]|nr:rubrerythrin family protein [bacterium]